MISIALEPFAGDDARLLSNRYFAELAARLENFDATPPPPSAYGPPEGRFFVARADGVAVGCVALRLLDVTTAEIKHFWVDTAVRGQGVGRGLLAAAEEGARSGEVQRIVLDSSDTLVEALSLYRSSGYAEIGRYNDNPFAQRWFEKRVN